MTRSDMQTRGREGRITNTEVSSYWMLVDGRGNIKSMPMLKAHFDGQSIVLDEPAELAVGQAVRVIVEQVAAAAELPRAQLAELARRTDEALKPTRDAFAASGMTDDELAEFLEVETHAMRGVPYATK